MFFYSQGKIQSSINLHVNQDYRYNKLENKLQVNMFSKINNNKKLIMFTQLLVSIMSWLTFVAFTFAHHKLCSK